MSVVVKQMHRKLKGGARIFEWQRILVCALCVLLVTVFCVGYFISDQRTRVTGLAQDIYYGATSYLVRCTVSGEKPNYSGGDASYFYITKAQTIETYIDKKIDSDFTVYIDRKNNAVVWVKCVKKFEVMGYVLESTGVYPADAGDSGARWYKAVKAQPQLNDPLQNTTE